MRVAGLGFRSAAPLASLTEALALAVDQAGGLPVDAVATVHSKAAAPVFVALCDHLAVPFCAVDVAGVATPTQSEYVLEMFGAGSVAEAAALAGAGPGARLIVGRMVSRDGMATAAIAEGSGQ